MNRCGFLRLDIGSQKEFLSVHQPVLFFIFASALSYFCQKFWDGVVGLSDFHFQLFSVVQYFHGHLQRFSGLENFKLQPEILHSVFPILVCILIVFVVGVFKFLVMRQSIRVQPAGNFGLFDGFQHQSNTCGGFFPTAEVATKTTLFFLHNQLIN